MDTFVIDVGSNELLTLVKELAAVLPPVGTTSETSLENELRS